MIIAAFLFGCGWNTAPSAPNSECALLTVASDGIALTTSTTFRLPLASWVVSEQTNAPANGAIVPLALALGQVPADSKGQRCVSAAVSPDTPVRLWSRVSATLNAAHVDSVDITLDDGSWSGRLALASPIDPVSSQWPPVGTACSLVWIEQHEHGACVWTLQSAQPGVFPGAAPNHFTEQGLQRCSADHEPLLARVAAVPERCERIVVATSPEMSLSAALVGASFAADSDWVLLSGASPRCSCGA